MSPELIAIAHHVADSGMETWHIRAFALAPD